MGNIRKKFHFSMAIDFSTPQPIDFLSSPDESVTVLVHVCCPLDNMCDSVIPFNYFLDLLLCQHFTKILMTHR